MHKDLSAAGSDDQQPNEPFSEQNLPHRKGLSFPCRRILKDHDLDHCLVYEKRSSKHPKDLNQVFTQQSRPVAPAKKDRKRQKLQTKQLNQQAQLQEKGQEISCKPSAQPNQAPATNSSHNSNQPTITEQNRRLSVREKTVYKWSCSSSEEKQQFKFPLINSFYSEHSEEYLETLAAIEKAKEQRHGGLKSSSTYLNCDVKYFNWDLFISQVGKFDVLVIDPPWRIKGAQKNDSQFMFSNCRFSLEYNTMSNHQIRQLPLHLISDQGFIFLWILNTQLNSSLEIMQEWGYELVEEIVWVKLRNQKVYLTHGYYFMHSYEICLVGYKNNRKDRGAMTVRTGINHNVVFGQVRKKSQKPEDIYSIIQMMFKGKRKLEIFARNHNLRFGMFSIGNQLGQAYDKWMLHLNCDSCNQQIKQNTKRYKSKIMPNHDICQKCITNPSNNTEQFFQFANQVDQDIRHEYLSCNNCGVEPIWGIRFQCLTCHDYDLCQCCFDLMLKNRVEGKGICQHPVDHQFRTLQVPVFGFNFAIHEYKCNSCYQNPIIGTCFSCTSCKNFKLCQKCFFERPNLQRMNSSKSHRATHEFEAMIEPMFNEQKKYECFGCKKQIVEGCWMCENCYNFFFCEDCYQDRNNFRSLYANTHKKYHVFTKLF